MKRIKTRPRRVRVLREPGDVLAGVLGWFLVFTVFFSWIAPGFFDAIFSSIDPIFSFLNDLLESGRRLFH